MRISLIRCMAAAAMTIALTAPVTGRAQESEIQQLRALIKQQQAQIDAMSKKLESIAARSEQASIAASPAGQPTPQVKAEPAGASQKAAPATPPKMIASENENVSLAISGQVNRALLYVDDGDKQDIYNVDNDQSSTRIRLAGKAKLSEQWTAGTMIEMDVRSNTSSAVNQSTDNGVGGTFGERKLELFFEGPVGKVSLGQGDTASNTTSEVDLSGTNVAGYSNINEYSGGFAFVNSLTNRFCTDVAGPGALPADGLCTPGQGASLDTLNTRIGQAFFNLDGLSRDDRIRYDTPKFMNFMASTSYVAGGASDVALYYAAEINAFKIAAAIAYADPSSLTARTGIDTQFNGSASILHSSGANITFAAGAADGKTPASVDPDFYYVKAGWLFKDLLSPKTKTGFAIDYNNSNEGAVIGDEGDMYGVSAVHTLSDYGTDLFTTYRHFELDRIGVNFDDIDSVMTGARIKF